MDNCLWKAAKFCQMKGPSPKIRNEHHIFADYSSVFSAIRKITAFPFRHYLAWGIGMSVAAVAVDGISLRLHPSAGFVAFAVLLGVQAGVVGQQRRRT
jgi:hypothetical protein